MIARAAGWVYRRARVSLRGVGARAAKRDQRVRESAPLPDPIESDKDVDPLGDCDRYGRGRFTRDRLVQGPGEVAGPLHVARAAEDGEFPDQPLDVREGNLDDIVVEAVEALEAKLLHALRDDIAVCPYKKPPRLEVFASRGMRHGPLSRLDPAAARPGPPQSASP